ncbi:type VI secretion system tip protein VgrG [Silvimonas sp.]|uniref:type VI secretion system Vgr family protein n=1 Tax=Silvimonas sp. TaxID=2650811 RepID=UPI002842D668|nr:type VI secretion system tip protein VgrG [Silvimonas sp.]MDR3428739.1 type VI secretion system tip protein VgrG [Silvimonas sp.]
MLDVPVVKSALSVKSFELTESLGRPYKAVIRLTSPDEALPLLKLLDQPASFSITPLDPDNSLSALAATKPTRQWHGVITGSARLSSSIDETVYEFTLEPRLARLKNHVDTVLHQNLDLPGVIEATLRSDAGLIGNDFVFQLTGTYPVKEHVTRYREDGLTFIRRLCEECGLFYFFRQTEDREIIVFGDDQTHYQKALNITLQRASAGLESPAQAEAIRSLNVHVQPVIGTFQRQDYNYRQSGGQSLRSETGAYPGQPGFVGKDYRFGEHQKTPDEGKTTSKLRFEAAQAQQVIASGIGNVIAFTPGQVFRPDMVDPDAEFGWVIVSVEHKANRKDAYTNEYTAIPADRIYRLPSKTEKPKIAGTIPARVTSPSRYTNAYLDESGRYRISFNFDNNEWPPAGSSRPVRLAKPYSGDTYGLHFPLIDGTEVQVAFVDGDIDRPYIAHALHDQTKPDHVTNKNNTRNIIRTPSNNKIRLEDKDDQQHIKVSTEYGKSQLNLGHLVNAGREKRGDGFELRTDGWGAVRSGKGLFLSADEQGRAGGKQLDMQPALEQLQRALQQAQALSEANGVAEADLLDVSTQQTQMDSVLKALQDAAILLSAPAGIAAVTPKSLQLSAQENHIVSAGGNADFSILKKFTVAAGEAITLCAHKLGMKLIANKGKVQIQAQSDELELTAAKNLHINSTEENIIIQGKKSITLVDGGGAYIKLANGVITIGSPNPIDVKSTMNLNGSGHMPVTLPTFKPSNVCLPCLLDAAKSGGTFVKT